MSDARAAGLPGTFRAWLGSSAGGPETRATHGSPWRRPDGALLGADDSVLTSADQATTLTTFISEYANGEPSDGSATHTGVNGMSCADWTSASSTDMGTIGQTGETVRASLELGGVMPCVFPERLICMEQ